MRIDANGQYYQQLNEAVRACADRDVTIDNVCGQRYIACAEKDRRFTLHGTPGNGLAQYMDGATVEVFGNCQESVGDTMNQGEVVIHGSCGDACAYGMRGGRILIEGNVGYRAGIHMKAYMEHYPVLIVGGTAGSFLGEYLAGGLILVLGLGIPEEALLGHFTGTGMHGGRIVLRCSSIPAGLPQQVSAAFATAEDLDAIRPFCAEYCRLFGGDLEKLMDHPFVVLTPNASNPYKRLYTQN